MPLPLLPLASAAAIGSIVTYLYTDRQARKKVKEVISNVTDKIKSYSETEPVDPEESNDPKESKDSKEAENIIIETEEAKK